MADRMITARAHRRRMGATGILVVALVVTLALGGFDYVSGRNIHVSAFYLVPVCWTSWTLGRRWGLVMAAIAAMVWLFAEILTGYPYLHWEIPYWNALMLLVLYLVVVYLLTAFQQAHCFLEETVRRRTEALQTEMAERKRLESAKIQAERLAVVGTMAASMAHEIRNPLGSISLNLDLVQSEILELCRTSKHAPDESRLLLTDLRAEVSRIQRVLEDYLQFARLPKLQRQPLVLNDFLGQKLAFLRSELERSGVKLQTRFDPSLAIVEFDAEKLWQAMLNLIRNSLEAMPSQGEMMVETRRNGAAAMVLVRDTGRGMTEEQRRQVFVPFFTTKPGGTGLGLALVQQIVAEHGGRIECESAPGQGSTFVVFLPLPGKR